MRDARRPGRARLSFALVLLVASSSAARAADDAAGEPPRPAAPARRVLDIEEYRVTGVSQLSTSEVESTLYPFLGPKRALEDVEHARAALEKAYSDKGFQSVSVAIPPQTVRDGVVALEVTERKVGRLRVRGSRWFLLSDIRRQAPSVAEGTVPNFNDIVRDIFVLNQLPDRRVIPALRAGVVPNTVDVDLNVEDTLPVHGSLELNDRYSSSTTPTRLNGSLRYDNLWQLGHSLSFQYQTAPQRLRDAQVFSASYLARIPDVPWLSFTVNGVLQNSDVSTLGDIAVIGRGRILGARATFTLPSPPAWFQTISTGLDCKHFLEGVTLGGDTLRVPLTYWPATADYSASWQGDSSQMQLGATVVFNVRALSSGTDRFDTKRYGSTGNFLFVRSSIGRSDDLPLGIQLSEKVQGQYSRDPLVGSEQLVGGGAESARGYLEGQAVGDFGAMGQVEVRSPSLSSWLGRRFVQDWRFLVFTDAGFLGIQDRLAEQTGSFLLWSAGGGTRFKVLNHVTGAVDVGVPLHTIAPTTRYRPRVHFRLTTEL